MNRFDAMTVSLSELSLNLLFSIMFIFAAHMAESHSRATEPPDRPVAPPIEKPPPPPAKVLLRSQIYPTCEGGPIFDVHVLDEDAFIVDGRSYSSSDLRETFDSQIRSHSRIEIGCVYQVLATFDDSLAAVRFNRAIKRLEKLFRVRRAEQ